MSPRMALGGLIVLIAAGDALGDDKKHKLPAPKKGGVVVGLCDGETHVEVTGVKPGEAMSRERAQAVSDDLMRKWREKHPDAHWDDALAQAGQGKGTSPQNAPQPAPGPQTGHGSQVSPSASPSGNPPNAGTAGAPSKTANPNRQEGVYSGYTGRDQSVWAEETKKFVEQGNTIFHSAGLLGGTIGVSCDMCHPNAANTHPETYPKYQVQLQRVALLRDMINWCIENPVKGKPLADGDARLKALEAFILAQRKGVALDYGKH